MDAVVPPSQQIDRAVDGSSKPHALARIVRERLRFPRTGALGDVPLLYLRVDATTIKGHTLTTAIRAQLDA